MKPKLIGEKLSPTGMLVIVAVNLGVTFKANWDGVLDRVIAAFSQRNNVVSLHLDTTEAMANAAPTVALREKLGYCVSWECQNCFDSFAV